VAGSSPNFWTQFIKLTQVPMAKFRGDRPRELGDYALKIKKHHEQNRRPPVLHVPTVPPNKLTTITELLNVHVYSL